MRALETSLLSRLVTFLAMSCSALSVVMTTVVTVLKIHANVDRKVFYLLAPQANHFTKEHQKRSRFVCKCPLRFHHVGDVSCRTKLDHPCLQQKLPYGSDFQRSTLLSNWKAVFLSKKIAWFSPHCARVSIMSASDRHAKKSTTNNSLIGIQQVSFSE